MKKEWQILRPDRCAVEKLTGLLNCHPAIASILVNRKIASPEDALNFLSVHPKGYGCRNSPHSKGHNA
jgi:hypothetical protein